MSSIMRARSALTGRWDGWEAGGFRHFVTSMLPRLLPAGAVAGRGLHPLDKRRLVTAHVESGHPRDRSLTGRFYLGGPSAHSRSCLMAIGRSYEACSTGRERSEPSESAKLSRGAAKSIKGRS